MLHAKLHQPTGPARLGGGGRQKTATGQSQADLSNSNRPCMLTIMCGGPIHYTLSTSLQDSSIKHMAHLQMLQGYKQPSKLLHVIKLAAIRSGACIEKDPGRHLQLTSSTAARDQPCDHADDQNDEDAAANDNACNVTLGQPGAVDADAAKLPWAGCGCLRLCLCIGSSKGHQAGHHARHAILGESALQHDKKYLSAC